VTEAPAWTATLLSRHAGKLHRWYVACQAEDPESFPIGEASSHGPHVWHNHVPGCRGSSYFKSKGDDFANMVNCQCHHLRAWLAIGAPAEPQP
jgi:hypothetical protein